MVMGDMEMSTDLLVIGSGPGGYSAAIRGAELGLDVILVDQEAGPGGTWLYQSCIPSQILNHLAEQLADVRQGGGRGIDFGEPKIDLAAIRAWKEQCIGNMADSLKKISERLGVLFIRGRARFDNSTMVRLESAELSRIRFKRAVIATGSGQPYPDFQSTEAGGLIMTPSMALSLPDIPSQLLVAGDDCSALELGSFYAALGSRVSLATAAECLLPGVDRDLAGPLEARLTTLFEKIMFGTKVTDAAADSTGITVTLSSDAGVLPASCDRLIIAEARRPNTNDLGLGNTAVTLDDEGFVLCNDKQQTADERIFAAGDVTGKIMQAHRATRQGRVAAEIAAGRKSSFDVRAIPAVIYTNPQISWCGLTENEAILENIQYVVQRFPWRYSAKALISGQAEGLTKLLTDPASGRILGAGIVGRNAGELIGEVVLAIEMGALTEDLALVLHPQPTLSATLKLGA